MLDQRIHVLGEEDIVIMLGLLGIEGSIIEVGASFLEKFNDLIKNPIIGMIIIGISLTTEEFDIILDFKLYNKTPLVFILPDMFRREVDKTDLVRNKIYESIGDIISSSK